MLDQCLTRSYTLPSPQMLLLVMVTFHFLHALWKIVLGSCQECDDFTRRSPTGFVCRPLSLLQRTPSRNRTGTVCWGAPRPHLVCYPEWVETRCPHDVP